MKNRKLWFVSAAAIPAVVILVLFLPRAGHDNDDARLLFTPPPVLEKIKVDMTKAQIVDVLGTPDKSERLVKRNEHIWGEAEDFWYDIPMGAAYDYWIYEFDAGAAGLWFLSNSDTLDYLTYTPEGVVY